MEHCGISGMMILLHDNIISRYPFSWNEMFINWTFKLYFFNTKHIFQNMNTITTPCNNKMARHCLNKNEWNFEVWPFSMETRFDIVTFIPAFVVNLSLLLCICVWGKVALISLGRWKRHKGAKVNMRPSCFVCSAMRDHSAMLGLVP